MNEIMFPTEWQFEVRRGPDPVYQEEHNGRHSVLFCTLARITLRNGAFQEDVGFGLANNYGDKLEAVRNAAKASVSDAVKRIAMHYGSATSMKSKEFQQACADSKRAAKSGPMYGQHQHQQRAQAQAPPPARPAVSYVPPSAQVQLQAQQVVYGLVVSTNANTPSTPLPSAVAPGFVMPNATPAPPPRPPPTFVEHAPAKRLQASDEGGADPVLLALEMAERAHAASKSSVASTSRA